MTCVPFLDSLATPHLADRELCLRRGEVVMCLNDAAGSLPRHAKDGSDLRDRYEIGGHA
jgi:hypothetical protein